MTISSTRIYGTALLLWLSPLFLFLAGKGCGGDADPLRGSWIVTQTIEEGRESEKNRGSRFTFDKGRVIFEIHDRRTDDVERDTGSYVLFPDAEPKRIDLEVKKVRFQGIYTIEEEELTICYLVRVNERPTSFTSESTKDLMIFRLRRDHE